MKSGYKTILYADDDPDDLTLLLEAVEATDKGYQTIEASDCLHALELLKKMKEANQFPCLIVLYINMLRMDGKQTLVAIQSNAAFSSVPVVLFSTSSSQAKAFSEARHVELLTKPLEFATSYRVADKLLRYCRA